MKGKIDKIINIEENTFKIEGLEELGLPEWAFEKARNFTPDEMFLKLLELLADRYRQTGSQGVRKTLET